jgi:hypothetical protein
MLRWSGIFDFRVRSVGLDSVVVVVAAAALVVLVLVVW